MKFAVSIGGDVSSGKLVVGNRAKRRVGRTKYPKTTWRYMRSVEVVAPGSEGPGMIRGVTGEKQSESAPIE